MGQGPSVPQNKTPLIVNFQGKTAIVARHPTYDDTLTAIKTVKTFKPELSNRDMYLTAHLECYGEEEFEITNDAWLKVIDSIDVLYIHIVGSNEGAHTSSRLPLIPSWARGSQPHPATQIHPTFVHFGDVFDNANTMQKGHPRHHTKK
ncbi:hypothetical protein CYLTODRAFT_227965 [Cylindrobasidium torrendii FP15055 ss-10]|uniref:Uncharacterized protein n=1 Tax=Cylindrobasidium torrendii FP15055 ss-10 TaxID=1314674 RepID=A0A0D7BIC8_9AGAR|nr:hypothetical protein CYLTODRAFT_227965 [Cylindrobasidium torrendii FP15055 ss-10]